MSGPEELPEPGDLTPEQREANRERNNRRIAEMWAEHEANTLELEELQRLSSPTPAQLRRIAELVDTLYDLYKSRSHWERAAEAGDPVAQARLITWDTDVSDIDPVGHFFRQVGLALRQATEKEDESLPDSLEEFIGHPYGEPTGISERLRRLAEDHTKNLRDLEAIRDMKPEDFEEKGN